MGLDDPQWGFEEAGDWEGEPGVDVCHDDVEALAGQDPDAAVTVWITPDGGVVAVELAPDWRRAVDPRVLHTSVRAAMNAATVRAMVRQMELSTPPSPPASDRALNTDLTPISRQDAQRLLDTVTADLDRFTRQLSAMVDRTASVESAGGHVNGSAWRGQLTELAIDRNWAATVRSSEIEAELLEVLRQLHDRSTPGELALGPQSPAISEFNALLADPQILLRRLGFEDAKRGGSHE